MMPANVKDAVYVFDVDGVLCDIGSFTTDERVIGYIAGLLQAGAHCAINTGRAYDRVSAEFVTPLRAQFPDVSLDCLFVSTEMGGEVTTFRGQQEISMPTEYALTPKQLQTFHTIWNTRRDDLHTMYLYEAKRAMGTTVRDHSYSAEEYAKQKYLFESWLKEAFIGQDVIIAGTVESTDVYASNAGKDAGASNVVEWLHAIDGETPRSAICFGDSVNDYEMARRFADNHFKTTFVYTGTDNPDWDKHVAVDIVDTAAEYTDGTVEYFEGKSLQTSEND